MYLYRWSYFWNRTLLHCNQVYHNLQRIKPGLDWGLATLLGRHVHHECPTDTFVESQVHAVHEVWQVVHKVLVKSRIACLDVEDVLVACLQCLQFGIKVLVFPLYKNSVSNTNILKKFYKINKICNQISLLFVKIAKQLCTNVNKNICYLQSNFKISNWYQCSSTYVD